MLLIVVDGIFLGRVCKKYSIRYEYELNDDFLCLKY